MNSCEDSSITVIKGRICVYIPIDYAQELERQKRLKTENQTLTSIEDQVRYSHVKAVGD